jgi:hypothetical protein
MTWNIRMARLIFELGDNLVDIRLTPPSSTAEARLAGNLWSAPFVLFARQHVRSTIVLVQLAFPGATETL